MLRKLTVIISLGFILFLTLPLTGCRTSQKTADQVTLQLNWVHSAEFIGYYMADAKGFYSEANIKAKISEGGPGIAARDMILNGKTDFAIASFDEQKNLIEADKPSVAVMSVFQVPPQVMFSLTESNIKEPKDLIGKRIGIKNDYWRDIERKTLSNAGIDPTKVIEVKVSSDAQNMLYDHEVDVWMGYAHDEPISAQLAGYSVTNIYPGDYGVGGYEGLLLVNEATISQKADMAGRFVQASAAGLKYALEHPDEAAQVMTKWQTKENLKYCNLAIRSMIPLVDIPQSKVGWIDGKRWEQLMGTSNDAQHPGYTVQFLQDK
jgi:ABC-type nitrate/sulfonate/bicarbonate transport system substrate-binding protein